jgi:hypothetical protein
MKNLKNALISKIGNTNTRMQQMYPKLSVKMGEVHAKVVGECMKKRKPIVLRQDFDDAFMDVFDLSTCSFNHSKKSLKWKKFSEILGIDESIITECFISVDPYGEISIVDEKIASYDKPVQSYAGATKRGDGSREAEHMRANDRPAGSERAITDLGIHQTLGDVLFSEAITIAHLKSLTIECGNGSWGFDSVTFFKKKKEERFKTYLRMDFMIEKFKLEWNSENVICVHCMQRLSNRHKTIASHMIAKHSEL